MRDFVRLGEDEVAVFERLLESGSSVHVLAHLPKQLGEIVQRRIIAERLTVPDELQAEMSARFEAGSWRVDLDWSAPSCIELPKSSALRALLMLGRLLEFLAGARWSEGGPLPADAPAVAQIVALARLKDEVARLFWLGFVVQRIGADAVRRKQRAAALGDGDAEREHAGRLRSRGVERAEAVKQLAQRFGVSERRARTVLADVGWHGTQSRRGRPRKSE